MRNELRLYSSDNFSSDMVGISAALTAIGHAFETFSPIIFLAAHGISFVCSHAQRADFVRMMFLRILFGISFEK